jgi:hypothetical protein
MKKQIDGVKWVLMLTSVAVLSGCASPGLKKMDSTFFQSFDSEDGVSVSGWTHMHSGAPPVMMAGMLGGAVGGGVAGAFMSTGNDYLSSLDEACIQVFESSCVSNASFKYVQRSALELQDQGKPISVKLFQKIHDEFGVMAFIEPQFTFALQPGFPSKLKLNTVWLVRSPDKKVVCKIVTKAIGGVVTDMFPYTGDPKHKAVFVQLARESAEQFLRAWPAQPSE